MCVKWFERLENPKQSQSWRTGNSLSESETSNPKRRCKEVSKRSLEELSIQEGLSEKAADWKTVYYGTGKVV